MGTRRNKKLYPRSFLPTRELDVCIKAEAVKRGMTYSQLIRHALIEWALYQQVKGASELRMKTGGSK